MEKVAEYIRRHQMLETGDKVIVGVSGGADSVCLLFLLKKYMHKFQISLEVVHMEHGIRGKESLQDAEFVENLCREWDIPFHLFRRDIPTLAKEWKCSTEEAGRRARYEAFEEVRVRTGGSKIAVAHNQDDQAETILFHLARGSGLKGLCGIFPVRDRIIRPLLILSRSEIEEILSENGLSFRVDQSNQEDVYTRNRIRLNLLPLMKEELNPRAAEHIAKMGERLLVLERFLEEEAVRRLELLGRREGGRLCLDRTAFLREPEAMQDYMLLECLRNTLEPGEPLKNLEAVHLESLKKLAVSQSGRFLTIGGSTEVRTEGEQLVFCRKETAKEPVSPDSVPLNIPGETRYGKWRVFTEILPYKNEIIPENRYTKWLDYDTITSAVQLRTRQKGDYLVVTSDGGIKTLKKYFIDEKIPASQRAEQLLLADGAHILWVPGYRISQRCKITEKTRKVLKIQIEEESSFIGAAEPAK